MIEALRVHVCALANTESAAIRERDQSPAPASSIKRSPTRQRTAGPSRNTLSEPLAIRTVYS